MLIADQTARAIETLQTRERDALLGYAPAAVPERADAARSTIPITSADPLSATAPEDAYFITADERGRSLYTRDGRFSFRNGALVDAEGYAVLGFADATSVLGPLRADPVDAALGLTARATVQSDGSVTYVRRTVDPRTGAFELLSTCIGRIALARFAAATKLQAVDPQHAAAPPGGAPHVGRAQDGNFGSLRPRTRESSGVDIDRGLERLQEAYMALDAIRAATIAKYGSQKIAMDLLK